MKVIKADKLLLGMLVMVSAICTAQTVNSGDLYISPGTVMNTVGAFDNRDTANLVNDGELYVYSHFNNDGLVGFTPGSTTGMTRVAGIAGFQDISGSVPVKWYNTQWNNSATQPAFHLSNEISMFGKSDFTNGIIDDDTYGGLVVFEDNASHINVSDISYVQGFVNKNGKDSFLFPIGDKGNFRPAGISNPGAATDAFIGKYFMTDPDVLYPLKNKAADINLIDNKEYWTVTRAAGVSNLFLTLSWKENVTMDEIYAASDDEIHIVRWDAVLNSWVDEGGVTDGRKEVTMVVNPLENYGVFTLARVKKAIDEGIVVFNGLSPNADGYNDYFKITGLQVFASDKITIYNRWGVVVYETQNYDTSGNNFRGISEGRGTLGKENKLPSGTYFYTIDVVKKDGKNFKKAGYLYIND
ncbi:gliding motility-associated-like protein [Flavobacterium sp. 9]|uniref:gliding motility-associated C-terminal domain-containing protein n=1 Tax=Flavobacterium sp. 9 TaxID=2035198 RepID=UPI000C4DF7C2|nr:gliding motility-associated C-terminal domain-containing protein [Flavobacterium sp. 9]PIF30180.1 gliding motility-associated-like protein [Flavobacterium sp. 9]